MKKSNSASIDSIESAGMVDGPGIRTVVFFSGCMLRCKYCHNPETWKMCEKNYTVDELFNRIIRNKSYFKNGGGVTFSGGEPLLQSDFLLELSKKLKEEEIHIALDTAGVSKADYTKLLPWIDLVILDIKHVEPKEYKNLVGYEINESMNFINKLKETGNKLWLRQVIIPTITDTKEYVEKFKNFIKYIPNIEKVEFIPYHTFALNKYKKLNIDYPLKDIGDMSKEKTEKLYDYFNSL